jgi:CheY-like chemotaxis protein
MNRHSKRVLLAEDDQDQRKLARLLLDTREIMIS